MINQYNSKNRKDKSGLALIITLWISLLLSIVAFTAAYFSRIDLKMAEYHSQSLEAYALARGGAEIAIAKLVTDSKESPSLDAYNENWPIDQEELKELDLAAGKLEVKIIDESSKFNLNMEDLYNLINLLQFLSQWKDYEELDILLDSFKDWRDEDSFEELNGAENPYYSALPSSYLCKNGKFDIVEEILLVRGMKKELLSDNLFKVFGDEKININTVGEDNLTALLKSQNVSDAEIIASSLISYRQGEDGIDGTDDDQPFTSLANPLIPVEIQDLLKIGSTSFKVVSIATFKHSAVRKKIEVILDRKVSPVKILYWKES